MKRLSVVLVVSALAGLLGCGESGSDPEFFPEVRFEVIPAGASTFEVESLAAGTIRHTFPPGTRFTATSTFNFFLEGAPPPYRGTFRRVAGGEITVRLSLTTPDAPVSNVETTSPTRDTVSVFLTTGGVGLPSGSPRTPNPEVRFDVCAPVPGSPSCSLTGDAGTFGIEFGGSIGDQRVTHLVGRVSNADPPMTTPSVYFLEDAKDSVNAVFRSQSDSDRLVVHLIINGVLRQTKSNNKDVVIREDL